MHRSIIRMTLFAILTGLLGSASAKLLSPTEQRWVDAHPVVRYSIHEKYASYLETNESGESGVFLNLLSKLEGFTKQEFVPKWRKSDHEGLQQLAAGEVDQKTMYSLNQSILLILTVVLKIHQRPTTLNQVHQVISRN